MPFYRLLQYPDRVETYIVPEDTGLNGFDQVWRPTSWLATATQKELDIAGVALCSVTGDAWGDPAIYANSYVADGLKIVVTSKRRPDLPAVPDSVPSWAGRAAVAAAGLRVFVEEAVNAADLETQKLWYTAPIVERQNPLLIAVAGSLGLTDAKLDALFIAAKFIADGAA